MSSLLEPHQQPPPTSLPTITPAALAAAEATTSPCSIPSTSKTHISSSPTPSPPTTPSESPSKSPIGVCLTKTRSHESTLRALTEATGRIRGVVEEFLERDEERLRSAQAQVRRSRGIIEEAFRRYSMQTLSLSFNGGKDCLLLLLLVLSSLPTPPPLPLQSIYVPPPSPFPSVTTFVQTCVRTYGLHLTSYPLSMKSAFTAYLDEHPWIRGIFVGTRRTDPHGATLGDFEKTDGGWAEFVRVNPVLDWGYDDVWIFLREVGEPVCELYERGYTSLGGVEDTVENPALRREDGSYRPAWELEDGSLERAGRIKRGE